MVRVICPVCKGKDFEEITTNGVTILICKEDGSCFSRTNNSWFHKGKKEINKCRIETSDK